MHKEGKIIDVFEQDFLQEMKRISELIERYNYVSLDTEFPGIVYYSTSSTKETESNYLTIKKNVDNLKMIQIGITLSDAQGNFPEGISTWQFNFNFDIDVDISSPESITLLESAGIDFQNFLKNGIDPEIFAEYFLNSGLVLNENVHWITFHGIYDFAYVLKLISGLKIPEDEEKFNEELNLYFPNFYDIRSILNNFSWIRGSLTKIANDFKIKRIGSSHQAGSDSLITTKLFFRIMNEFYDQIDLKSEMNKVFGIGYTEDYKINNFPQNSVGANKNPINLNQMYNINLIQQNISQNPVVYNRAPNMIPVNNYNNYSNMMYYNQPPQIQGNMPNSTIPQRNAYNQNYFPNNHAFGNGMGNQFNNYPVNVNENQYFLKNSGMNNVTRVKGNLSKEPQFYYGLQN